MAPGGNVFTSIYNMVLNTVNSAAFNATLNQVQTNINKITLATTRASNAASAGTNAANIQKAAYDKLTATYARNLVSLDQQRTRVAATATAAQAAAKAEAALQLQYTNLTASISRQQAVIAKHTAAGTANKGLMAAWKTALASSQASLTKLSGELTKAAATTQKATDKQTLYEARLKATEARLAAQKIKVDELNRPLSKFESLLASLIQGWRVVDQGSKAFDKLKAAVAGATGGGAGGILSGLSGGLAGIGGSIGNALKALNPFSAAIAVVQKSFDFLGQVAAYVFGHLIARSIEQAAGAVVQWATSTIQSTVNVSAATERFVVALKSVIAVQTVNADTTKDINVAMKESTVQAARLLHWLEQLGINSIFSVEDVKLAFQHATEMGFNTDQARRLTVATLDWAAANSKGGDTASHVVFVLGQIRNAGKLAYQDLYQLAQVGIGMDNINRQLAKQLGVTIEEIYKLRDAGKITAEQGIEAITTYMEQFHGAAEEQAHTLEGLITSLSDIGPLLARNLFGPVNLETGKVGGVIGALQTRLEKFVDFLKQDWVFALTNIIGDQLGGIADSAFSWGESLMTEYANGIYAGLNGVIDALISIFNQVAYWLAPGSPPHILPNIDRWGTEAMTEYFKGFALADFGVFKDIGGEIESFLRSTIIYSDKDKVGILDRILGSREGLAKAVQQLHQAGTVTEAMFQQVFSLMGGASTELQDFIRSSVALEQQNRKVTAAQDALNAVTKKYNDLLKPIDDALQGVDDAQQNILDDQRIMMLRLVEKDPNATPDEKRLARLEIQKIELGKQKRLLTANAKVEVDAAQKTLDAETEKQRVLAEQNATQKALLDAQIDQNKLLQEYLDLLEKLDEKEKAGGGGTPPSEHNIKPPTIGGAFPEPPKPELPQWIQDLIDKLGNLQAAWNAMWANIIQTLQPVFIAWDRVKDAWQRLVDKFKETVPEINGKIAELIAWTVQRMGESLPETFGKIERGLDHLTGWWDKNHTEILNIALIVWKIIVNFVLLTLNQLAWAFEHTTELMDRDWSEFWARVKAAADKFIGFIKTNVRAFLEVLSGILHLWSGLFTNDWNDFWLGLKLLMDGTFTLINTALTTALGALKLAYDGWATILHDAWGENWDKIQTKIEEVMTAIADAFNHPAEVVQSFIDKVTGFWTWLTTHAFPHIDFGGGQSETPPGPGGAKGLDFVVPPGYPHDSFPFRAQSGERVTVMPKSQSVSPAASARQILAGATGGDMGAGVQLVTNYNYSPTYSGAPPSPVQDFTVMQVWSR